MATGGGQGTTTLAFELSALKRLGDPSAAFSNARTWTKYISVASEKPICVVTNFTWKERIRRDFFSGPHDVGESLESVMRQLDTDRYVFIGTSDEDRAVAKETDWEYLLVEDTAEAAEWVLAGDDGAPANPSEAEGHDDWP